MATEDTTAWYDAQSWFAKLPGSVTWDPDEGRLTWYHGDHWVALKADPPYALRDGLPVAVAVPPRLGLGGELWISESFLRETGPLLLAQPVRVVPWGEGRLRRIVVDPSAAGESELAESSLALARAVGHRLEDEGFEVFITGAGGGGLDPASRAAFTNYREADLYLGLEVPGAQRPLAAGFEVFVARRPPAGVDAGAWDGGQVVVYDDSVRWAALVRARLGDQLATFDRGRTELPSPTLDAVTCPAVIVELAAPVWEGADGESGASEWKKTVAEALARAAVSFFTGGGEPAGSAE